MVASNTSETSEFNSFYYWQPVLPDIEAELLDLSDNSQEADMSMEETSSCDDSKFDSFNYWREPIQEVTLDLSML